MKKEYKITSFPFQSTWYDIIKFIDNSKRLIIYDAILSYFFGVSDDFNISQDENSMIPSLLITEIKKCRASCIKEIREAEKNEQEKLINIDLFEECWKLYHRKGNKKKSIEQWSKLSKIERTMCQPHIKAYVSSRDLQYQKDFERYLRDKVFTSVVFKDNKVIYDPTKCSDEYNNIYMPVCDGALSWNDYYNCYIYIGYWDGHISDGYNDTSRPDGACIMLNNGRGTLIWDKQKQKWINT